MAARKPKKHKPSPKKNGEFLRVFPSLGFSLLKGIFDGAVGKAWDELVGWNFSNKKDWALGPVYYKKLWESVVEQQEFARHPQVGTGIQDYWLERLLDNPNPFHRKAELAPFGQITPSLAREYEGELRAFLQNVVRMDWEGTISAIHGELGFFTPSLAEIKGLGLSATAPSVLEERRKIKEKILKSDSPGITQEIADFFFRNGFGLFGHYRAFRWEGSHQGEGKLAGVEGVDSIRLENLIGYDEQRKALLENIEAFVAGKSANNALIYGERGTGKSSTVKALLNAYGEKGLRLVEVSPADLMEYHGILRTLRHRREKFILFVDDLSFEENETSYKGLKALLEGTLEATPANVILIATSNRRHLIREFFTEREEGVHEGGEVHGQDTVEEKLSLSDRFGLVVSFYTPSQETYLRIVDSWAKFEGLKVPAVELHARALQWEKLNNVRSGRTARQFINDLKGKT